MKPIIAITMGDAAGIGPEICLKAVASRKLRYCSPLIVGTADVFEKLRRSLKVRIALNPIRSVEEAEFKRETIDVLDTGDIQTKKLMFGKVSAVCGFASINCVRIAARLAANGEVDAVTTAPINKEAVHLARLKYTGHTELLRQIFRAKVVMMFVARNLRIALVTRHLPIKHVPRAVTKQKILETIRIIYKERAILGLRKPTFAVLSLNPHAGEGGIIGKEEEQKIIPAIQEARSLGINISGPYPPDGFFGSGKQKRSDIVIAMYHDQGLIPYKMAAFGRGVNVTLGLPIIRTSVDHGTAYDIAGRGIANEGGLIQAIRLASLMAKMKKSLRRCQ